jgi:membrane dipeptidase
MRLLTDWPAIEAHLADWRANPSTAPFGIILCMEGADPIVGPDQLELWWNDGLRVVSLAHYGPSAYAHGTASVGGVTPAGFALLDRMAELGVILDVTHLVDESFWQAVEHFPGRVLASHSNARALVPGDRQLSDDMLRHLFARDAVIGCALDAWMLVPAWVRGETTPEAAGVTLEAYVNQIDYICQLAGNPRHAAIGTDLDGGYGIEQTPTDLDTIADLQRIPDLLRARGSAEADVEAILHGNWLRCFQAAWTGA